MPPRVRRDVERDELIERLEAVRAQRTAMLAAGRGAGAVGGGAAGGGAVGGGAAPAGILRGAPETGFTVAGAGLEAVNGYYAPCDIPNYAGAPPYSNGRLHLFRWHRRHWVISDLGSDGRSDFDESRWLYAVPNSDETPPLTGWETQMNAVGPPPSLTRGFRFGLGSGSQPQDPRQTEDTRPVTAEEIQRALRKAIGIGVPLWNKGDFAGCAAEYLRVVSRFQQADASLAQAVRDCEGQSTGSASDSQGWILRRAMDACLERIGRGSWQPSSPAFSKGPGELPISPETRKSGLSRGRLVATTAPRQTPEDRARLQLECIQTFYAEALQGTEVPQDLAARLKPKTPLEEPEFEQLCTDLGQKHKVNADPRFWTGAVVKQGWLFKRAGNWDFWHKYFAVVRGTFLTFFTVENPLEELDEKQLRWHTAPARRIDLKLCQAVLPPAPTTEDASPDEATADFRIASAHLATGHLELRCETPEEANGWVECMKIVCPEKAEAEPKQDHGGHMGRTSSLGRRIQEMAHSREAGPVVGDPDPNPDPDPVPVLAPNGPVVLEAPAGPGLIRQMSDTEKQRLVASLETLPQEEIDRVVAIVQEHLPAGAEIDLDQLPLAALWRIKSLVDGAVAAPEDAGTPAALDAGAVYTWQWNNDGIWQAYDESLQAELRAAHLRGIANGVGETVMVRIGRFRYHIRLSTMTQRNIETGNERPIRMLTAGDDPTEGNAPRVARRARRPPEPTEAQIQQLHGFTGASTDACRDAFRRAGGNLDVAAGILFESLSAGSGGPPLLAGDGSPMPPHDEMIHAIWSQLVPEGRSMRFEEMRRFLHVLNELEGDGEEELTQDEWNEMCQQRGFARDAGLTEVEFRDLIFDDLDPTDRSEMQQLFKMYEHVVLAAQRARSPEDAAAGGPSALPAAVLTPPTQDPAPIAPVHSPARAPSQAGESVRLAPWRTRDQFTDDEQYGAYIQATLQVGMRVRARCHAESVIETGDEGVYLQTNGGEPPCQVRWDGYGGTYWVQWYHVEIIQPADAAGQDGGAGARLPAEEPVVDEAVVQQLVSFGFDATQAAAALERVGGDLNGAIDLLSAGM